eukprot:339298-Alexandrium_andersonii.AAC.1
MRFGAREEEGTPALVLRVCACAASTAPRVGGPSLCVCPVSREIVLSAISAQHLVPHTVRTAHSLMCMNRATRLPRPTVST